MDFIEKNANYVINENIAHIAKASGVSEAALVRFAKKIGYDGFWALKLDLVKKINAEDRAISDEILVLKRIMYKTLCNPRNIDAIRKSINLCINAKDIYLIDDTGNDFVCKYFQYELFNQRNIIHHRDNHLSMMKMSKTKDSDVIIILHSFYNKNPLPKIYNNLNAKKILITLEDDRFFSNVDAVIRISYIEDIMYRDIMIRDCILSVFDLIALNMDS
ncbi:MAG: hypothetical protein MR210_02435 [Erysipelotrichaceae bacterium]|nr:hypothetical protein [Erysipelotrichaceae bacterium]